MSLVFQSLVTDPALIVYSQFTAPQFPVIMEYCVFCLFSSVSISFKFLRILASRGFFGSLAYPFILIDLSWVYKWLNGHLGSFLDFPSFCKKFSLSISFSLVRLSSLVIYDVYGQNNENII